MSHSPLETKKAGNSGRSSVCPEPESGFGSGLLALQISSVVGLRIRDLGLELLELTSSDLGCWCEKELPAGDKSPPSHPHPVALLRNSNLSSTPFLAGKSPVASP